MNTLMVRSIDVSGDWKFGAGQQSYVYGLAAVSQLIQTDCLSFLGDCFWNVTAGIDWYNLLTVNNLLAIQLAMSATILNVGGGGYVTQIVSLNITTNNSTRLFSATYTVNTIYGPINNQSFNYPVSNPQYLLTQAGQPITTQGGEPILI